MESVTDPKMDAAILVRVLREKAELAEDDISAQTYRRFAKMIERALKPEEKTDEQQR